MAQRSAKGRTDEELFHDWLRWIDRAVQETIAQAWRHKMFRLMRGIYLQNAQLQNTGGFLIEWAFNNYVAGASMAFRRELDTQPGTENLFHLLCELQDRPSVISRARFCDTWGRDDSHADWPNRAFDTYRLIKDPDRAKDHIDPQAVTEDLDKLRAQDAVLEHIQTTIAHRVPARPNVEVPTLGEFHTAIGIVRDVVVFYNTLLTHKTLVGTEPIAQYDIFEPFRAAWIPNPENFDYEQSE